MPLSEALLPEFDQEMRNTRMSLERVPDDRLTWKPHPKSWDFASLATHLSTLPSWTVSTIAQDSLDISPPGGGSFRAESITSAADAVRRFDKHVAEARAAIEAATDEQLLAPWTLLAGGQEMFTMPKLAVLRSFVMNHIIHHRAQLGVYLRLNDIPVPSIYGSSADKAS